MHHVVLLSAREQCTLCFPLLAPSCLCRPVLSCGSAPNAGQTIESCGPNTSRMCLAQEIITLENAQEKRTKGASSHQVTHNRLTANFPPACRHPSHQESLCASLLTRSRLAWPLRHVETKMRKCQENAEDAAAAQTRPACFLYPDGGAGSISAPPLSTVYVCLQKSSYMSSNWLDWLHLGWVFLTCAETLRCHFLCGLWKVRSQGRVRKHFFR